ncbi:MAG TPA: alpha/beta hydrolase [Mycobacterium sp.]|nr:alpha/beta hydrolase [Mycobacterium sp.]
MNSPVPDSTPHPDAMPTGWNRTRFAAVITAVALVLLLVNTVVVDRVQRAAEPFGGGRVLDLAGAGLNVREYGSGGDRAVVLLHGYSASIQWWEAVAPALAHGTRLIAIDLVGHGGSAAPRNATEYRAEAQATAVRHALDALGVRHAVLVGHSMGGSVATALAETAPDLVDRVVVVDTIGAPGLAAMPALGNAVCWPVIGQALDRLRRFDRVDETALRAGFAPGFPVPEVAYRSLRRMTHTAVCDAKRASVTLNNQRAVADRLAGLGKPVLVVWGERDVLGPTQANVDRYRAAGLSPVIIAGSGHSPMIEKPTDFVTAVNAFVHAG